MFVAKYDFNGNVLWAKSAGGSNHVYGESITTDSLNNLYVTGSFYCPTILFGSTTLTNMGSNDIFITKYDSLGNVIWAKGIGGGGGESPNSIASNSSGIYVVGEFWSPSLNFDAITLTNNATSNTNLFIAKYDFTGNAIWAKSAGGMNANTASSVATDSSGIFVTGYSNDTLIALDGITLLFPGEYSTLFVAKYNANGNILCATALKNKINTQRASVATDNFGSAYFSSNYSESPFVVGSSSLTGAGGWTQQIFIAKYNCSVEFNSVDEIIDQENISIYPNPASISFIVTSSVSKIKSIKIIDMLGKEIVNESLMSAENVHSFDVNGIVSGIYIIQTLDEKMNLVNKKIIIQ